MKFKTYFVFLSSRLRAHPVAVAFIFGTLLISGAALMHRPHAVSHNPLAGGLASVAGNGLIAPACGSATINTTCQGTSGLLSVWFNFTSCVPPVHLWGWGGEAYYGACAGVMQIGGFGDNASFNVDLDYAQIDGGHEWDYLNGVWIPVCNQ